MTRKVARGRGPAKRCARKRSRPWRSASVCGTCEPIAITTQPFSDIAAPIGARSPGRRSAGVGSQAWPRDAQPETNHHHRKTDQMRSSPPAPASAPVNGADTVPLAEQTPAAARVLPLPKAMRVLHWLTVLCLAMAATLILLRAELDGRALRQWLLEGHRHFGLLVLVLFALRIGLRLRLRRLPPGPPASLPMRLAAGATHLAMYGLMLALPLLGWSLSSAYGKQVSFFGVPLPALVAPDGDLGDTLGTWHLNAAWALLALVLLHIGAALWHHLVLRDGLLRRVLPGKHT
ncbi:cytochrome b [Xanthomonas phaseoli]